MALRISLKVGDTLRITGNGEGTITLDHKHGQVALFTIDAEKGLRITQVSNPTPAANTVARMGVRARQ